MRSQNTIHVETVSRKIDELPHSRFQAARPEKKKQRENAVRDSKDQVHMPGVKEMVNEQGEDDEVHDDGGGDVSEAELNAGQACSAAVIFRDRSQNDAPPEVPINMDVPFLPAGIDRVAPVFLIKEGEDFS